MRPKSALQSKIRKTGVIWDMDGTIADTAEFALAMTNEVLTKHGFRDHTTLITMEEYQAGAMYTTPRRLAWHAVNDSNDLSIGHLLSTDFDRLCISRIEHSTISLFPDAVSVIETLGNDQNAVQGVVSNACGEYVRRVSSHLGIAQYLSSCLGADDVSAAKPNPDGLLQCAKEIGVSPEFCIYVGDMRTDGIAARNAGMRSIYCSWSETSYDMTDNAAFFEYSASNRSELLQILSKFTRYCRTNNVRTCASRGVVWDADVVDNEHKNKMRADNEYWDGRR